MRNFLIIFSFFFVSNFIFSQMLIFDEEKCKFWHYLDPEKDVLKKFYYYKYKAKVFGISLNRAYKFLEKIKREPQPVIVAILDSGIDTTHNALKEVLWKNSKEIPNNNIDDDNNGYIDDVYGWNFLGNDKKENLNDEAYEYARIYGKWKDFFINVAPNEISEELRSDYELFVEAKKEFEKNFLPVYTEFLLYKMILSSYENYLKKLKEYLKVDSLTTNDLIKLAEQNKTDTIRFYAFALRVLYQKLNLENIEQELKKLEKKINTEYNYKDNLRALINDDPYNLNDSIYGNNDVMSTTSHHGTFVAGIIGGSVGIAKNNVKIMTVRIVPGGDERDKDVAMGIRYAVKNGAKIINMSFGKKFSPEKGFVDKMVKYAAENNVLIIHAAGNDATDNDKIPHYPTPYSIKGEKLTDLWIDVGAMTFDRIASFSNYGKNTVDLFAPGEYIYTTIPNNGFEFGSGTSAAAPVVTGVAALLMSYFPELSPQEIKEILLKSVYKPKEKFFKPINTDFFFSENYNLFEFFSNYNDDNIKYDLSEFCKTGGIINAYNAVKLAYKYSKNKLKKRKLN